jgi:hypothetical protein
VESDDRVGPILLARMDRRSSRGLVEMETRDIIGFKLPSYRRWRIFDRDIEDGGEEPGNDDPGELRIPASEHVVFGLRNLALGQITHLDFEESWMPRYPVASGGTDDHGDMTAPTIQASAQNPDRTDELGEVAPPGDGPEL